MSQLRYLRGRVFEFVRAPQSPEDRGAYRYLDDGVIAIEAGKIISVAPWGESKLEGEIVDLRPYLLMPGLIDLHLHMPQMQVMASYSGALLDWLNDHTFPVEAEFGNKAHADRMAKALIARLVTHGTTTAAAYCTSHPESVDAYFEAAAEKNMAMIGGKVMMDRGAPLALLDSPKRGYDESEALISAWHQKGRARYAITPRFALTSSPVQMEACQALAEGHPDCYIQTHIDENQREIAEAKRLYPQAIDYMGIYEDYGLLRANTLLGHCIHMTPREIEAMIAHQAVAVHCPTSNLFLGSGLFSWQSLAEQGARIGLATDIGGGTSLSMLRTMDEAYKIAQLQGRRLSPLQGFYAATLGNGEALGLADEIGTLAAGSAADIIALDANATPEMALRAERVNSIEDELFLLQTMGDDRAVKAVYIAGERQK